MKELNDKVALYGAAVLSDSELLAILVEDYNLATNLLSHYSFASLPVNNISRLRMADGLGLTRAVRLAAAVEFSRRRAIAEEEKRESIRSSTDAVNYFRPIFNGLNHEECWVVFLTSSGSVIERMRISQGGLQATIIDNRLIFKRAIELLATQMLIAHNHPSGNREPSQADIAMTRTLNAAANLFDIKLLDHIIITANSSYSFKEHGIVL
ncbi:MAG: DNA repair protein RadC [Rikenellaceae bacterium]|nr:DNA repair protein RadC [Rikenellaceae bacterium]